MSTQLKSARDGITTDQMKFVAQFEEMDIEIVKRGVASGEIVIPFNPNHSPKSVRGIGAGTRVKVNVNLGTSPNRNDLKVELEKVKLAHKLGADAVMDLSIGGCLSEIRQEILKNCELPLGTVPVYEAFEIAKRRDGEFWKLTADDIFEVILKQAKEGVDFITVHSGLTKHSLARLKKQGRKIGITSRGGSLLAEWMKRNNRENPLYEYYDRLLEIAFEYDVTLSLGDGLRPGCIADATDRAQIEELVTLGELAERTRQRGVQVMIEGPGHVPLDQIAANMQLQKSLCGNAPFYVLGPVVCDTAPGYDHITSAIGGSIAAMSGADFLCYVTPAEHLRLPTLDDVKEGIIAAKIAGFSADLARGRAYAVRQNNAMIEARSKFDWEKQFTQSLDSEKACAYHEEFKFEDGRKTCSMCGDFCALKIQT